MDNVNYKFSGENTNGAQAALSYLLVGNQDHDGESTGETDSAFECRVTRLVEGVQAEIYKEGDDYLIIAGTGQELEDIKQKLGAEFQLQFIDKGAVDNLIVFEADHYPPPFYN
jgi:hypothetical protein